RAAELRNLETGVRGEVNGSESGIGIEGVVDVSHSRPPVRDDAHRHACARAGDVKVLRGEGRLRREGVAPWCGQLHAVIRREIAERKGSTARAGAAELDEDVIGVTGVRGVGRVVLSPNMVRDAVALKDESLRIETDVKSHPVLVTARGKIMREGGRRAEDQATGDGQYRQRRGERRMTPPPSRLDCRSTHGSSFGSSG